MFRTILLPTDFSEPSARAARYAAAIAMNAGAKLHAISIVDASAIEGDVKNLLKQFTHYAVDEASSLIGMVERPHLQFEYNIVSHNSPSSAILKEAQRINADLIVMGTHSRKGLPAMLLGSVTEKVLRGTLIPLLGVGRGNDQLEIFKRLPKNLIVAVDFSEASILAIQQAIQLARLWNGVLHLVHIIEMTVSVPYTPISASPVLTSEPEINESSKKSLYQLAQELIPSGIPYQLSVLEGDPCQRLKNYAKENECELLVAGTQGHSKLERWLLGSTCERLLKTIEIPIWIQPHPNRVTTDSD